MKSAFTLIEVLVVCAILAVLVAIAIPATTKVSRYTARVKSVSNMRQIGVAAHLYAVDHNQQLPGQSPPAGLIDATPPDRWPALFCAYLSPSDPAVFLDNRDPVTTKLPLPKVLSNEQNNTGYVYNGFDEFAVDDQPTPSVSLNRLGNLTEVVLLAQKSQGATQFYVSPLFNPIADLFKLLNPAAYDGGSHYLFADGSVRFIKQAEYNNTVWLADKTLSLPFPPLPPLPPIFNLAPRREPRLCASGVYGGP